MPYRIVKNEDNSFAVVNQDTGKRMSKHTTKGKARKQIRLLNAEDHGWMPGRRVRRRRRG